MQEHETEAVPLAYQRSGQALRVAALVLAAVISIIVLLLAVGTLFEPGISLPTLIATMAWPIIGPYLVLAGLVASALAVPIALGRRPGRQTGKIVIASLAVASLIYSSVITTSIVRAANESGGKVNPISALVIGGPSAMPDATETYGNYLGQALKVLIFAPTSASDAPVLFYIHGGGWVSGTASQYGSTMRRYAELGFVVFDVNYTLATKKRATWNVAPAEVGCALTWASKNAVQWGGNPAKISVMGDSAGGNLAINLAWSAAEGKAASVCPRLGGVPVPKAVVAAYPVVNPGYSYSHGRTWLFSQQPKVFISEYLGGIPSRYPNRLRAISAETYLSKSVPPTLLIEPERDDFIPHESVYDVAAVAKRIGARVSLTKVPFAHHSFDGVPGSLGDEVKRALAEHFLAELGVGASGR